MSFTICVQKNVHVKLSLTGHHGRTIYLYCPPQKVNWENASMVIRLLLWDGVYMWTHRKLPWQYSLNRLAGQIIRITHRYFRMCGILGAQIRLCEIFKYLGFQISYNDRFGRNIKGRGVKSCKNWQHGFQAITMTCDVFVKLSLPLLDQ